jgi:hypothetical protein
MDSFFITPRPTVCRFARKGNKGNTLLVFQRRSVISTTSSAWASILYVTAIASPSSDPIAGQLPRPGPSGSGFPLKTGSVFLPGAKKTGVLVQRESEFASGEFSRNTHNGGTFHEYQTQSKAAQDKVALLRLHVLEQAVREGALAAVGSKSTTTVT